MRDYKYLYIVNLFCVDESVTFEIESVAGM
jgi:hypothetical protein